MIIVWDRVDVYINICKSRLKNTAGHTSADRLANKAELDFHVLAKARRVVVSDSFGVSKCYADLI